MLKLDFVLLEPELIYHNDYKNLKTAKVNDICYYLFHGDLVFIVGEYDFSAKWHWVPLLDFAAQLCIAVKNLQKTQQAEFEFTESDDKIFFMKHNGQVVISTTYSNGSASTEWSELMRASKSFSLRLLMEIFRKYPKFKKNYILKEWFPDKAILENALRKTN